MGYHNNQLPQQFCYPYFRSPTLLILVSDKGTVLKSQLGSGTNVSAAPFGTQTVSASDPNAGSFGGADSDRGGNTASAAASHGSDGTTFSQGTGQSGAARVVITTGVLGVLFGVGVVVLM
jgi:hypothetical protein